MRPQVLRSFILMAASTSDFHWNLPRMELLPALILPSINGRLYTRPIPALDLVASQSWAMAPKANASGSIELTQLQIGQPPQSSLSVTWLVMGNRILRS